MGKNMKLLRVYSTYCIVCLCVYTLFILLTLGLGIYLRETGGREPFHDKIMTYISFLRLEFVGTLIIIGSHAYFFLLLRSEIIKLENNCYYRFVNNAGNEVEILYTLENGINTNELGTTTHKIGSGSRILTNEANGHNYENNDHDNNTSIVNETKEQTNAIDDVINECESQSFNYKILDNY